MFPGTFAPWNKSSWELLFPGAKVPSGNFCSEEQKYRATKSLTDRMAVVDSQVANLEREMKVMSGHMAKVKEDVAR